MSHPRRSQSSVVCDHCARRVQRRHALQSRPRTSDAPSQAGETVLAIGSSATEGDGVRDRLQDAWPYLVFRESLPASAVFVNGALDDATVAHALASQAPLAKELKPDIVEIWLGADDLRAGTPIAAFTAEYTQLVDTLRADGSGRILIADLPAAYGSRASAYNAAIHAVVARTRLRARFARKRRHHTRSNRRPPATTRHREPPHHRRRLRRTNQTRT